MWLGTGRRWAVLSSLLGWPPDQVLGSTRRTSERRVSTATHESVHQLSFRLSFWAQISICVFVGVGDILDDFGSGFDPSIFFPGVALGDYVFDLLVHIVDDLIIAGWFSNRPLFVSCS